MVKRTDTNIAVLVQVMDKLGFDQETIGKVTSVPLRTITILQIGAVVGLIQPSLTSCESSS